MMTSTPVTWPQCREQMKLSKLQRLQHTEFDLKLTHPDVFVSYRAALAWAHQELTDNPARYTGDPEMGWCVSVYAEDPGYVCSISQTWWAADHCGEVRPTGALAIVQAVLEMQSGY